MKRKMKSKTKLKIIRVILLIIVIWVLVFGGLLITNYILESIFDHPEKIVQVDTDSIDRAWKEQPVAEATKYGMLHFAQDCVRDLLRYPDSANFPKSLSEYNIQDGVTSSEFLSGEYRVSGYVDSNNFMNDNIRNYWEVTFTIDCGVLIDTTVHFER